MTRKYKRTPGSKKYADFTASTLEEYLNAIRSGEISQRQEADPYNINRSTIKRFANNIKRAHAAIDETIITQYVDNLSDLTKDVPPDRIYNYDETCMSDDPGRSKIICRRGCKYPESVINSTKSTVTVMLCGNAAGSSIPPYIVYRITWAENGPMGT
ncbi:hypothetical protein J437_LFUL017362 [Ladona fulva]|uniref:HTH psq-type domain-containing protein n=1 Tax=Ladona fulva TaxID=123851 RepID=A0A8K0KMV0_LADFU|nr:hypothetical protein J437_LFUL017362 [Ladona fulva]